LIARRWLAASILLVALPLAACHSAFVQATITNNSGAAVTGVQVDYPSASFGLNTIPDRSDYHYRFKILGSGKPRITFTDAQRKTHVADGPELHENEEGTLGISIGPGNQVSWQPSLSPSH
jgi:hypothetical protein